MRKSTVVGVIVGVMLGSTAGGLASPGWIWNRSEATYSCKGSNVSVFCKETNWKPAYQMAIIPGNILVSFQGRIVFGCDRGTTPAYNCQSFVPGP